MLLYKCTACQNDDHEHCKLGYGDGQKFGGGRCTCPCRGRSKSQWQEEDNAKFEQFKKDVWKQLDPNEPRKSFGPIGKQI